VGRCPKRGESQEKSIIRQEYSFIKQMTVKQYSNQQLSEIFFTIGDLLELKGSSTKSTTGGRVGRNSFESRIPWMLIKNRKCR
jgi:hypothetical protein